jgi:hypothetical protein
LREHQTASIFFSEGGTRAAKAERAPAKRYASNIDGVM